MTSSCQGNGHHAVARHESVFSSRQDRLAHKHSTSRQLLAVCATFSSLPVLLAVAYLAPFERIPWVCPWYRLMGLPCPTCGVTRAVSALVHLDLGTAVRLNPLAIVFAPIVVLSWLVACCQSVTRRRTVIARWAGERLGFLVLLGVCLVFVFGVLRLVFLL